METLRRRADFEQVFSLGKVTGGRALAVRVHTRGEGPSRVGMAVGKRLDKRAVVRNRVRRRFREIVCELPLRDGCDIVMLARRPALTLEFAPLRADIRRTFRRAGLLEEQDS